MIVVCHYKDGSFEDFKNVDSIHFSAFFNQVNFSFGIHNFVSIPLDKLDDFCINSCGDKNDTV